MCAVVLYPVRIPLCLVLVLLAIAFYTGVYMAHQECEAWKWLAGAQAFSSAAGAFAAKWGASATQAAGSSLALSTSGPAGWLGSAASLALGTAAGM